MKWIPHNYQTTALSFLLSKDRAGLFLDPGLGKTSISLSAIKILKSSSEINGVLIVAPLRVVYSVWGQEIKKWENFKSITYTILHNETKNTLFKSTVDVYLTNPESLKWLHGELLNGVKKGLKLPFDTLIIDESTKFKSSSSSRFKLLRDMLPIFKRRYILTGTPVPKSLIDLWSQIFILDNGKSLNKSFYHFRNNFFKSDDWNKYNWELREGSENAIYKAIGDLVLNMNSKDYLEMPPLIFNYINVHLDKIVMRQYKKMEHDLFLKIDNDEITAEAAAQATLKCHQIANGKIYEDFQEDLPKQTRKIIHIHDSKLKALRDLIDELNGKPLLIAYHYKHDFIALRSMLGNDLPNIGSGITPSDADKIVENWNNGKINILAAHPLSMAHGLNLQGFGNDVCWYSLTWSLENYLQFNARIYRQGVKRAVRIHHLVATNTIDEAMILRLGDRAKNQIDLRKALTEYRRNTIKCS